MCLNPPEPMPERDAVRSKRLEEIYEQEDKLGSGLIDHSQKMTAAAMQIAEK